MKRVLITGGAGFIGTHIAERLVDDHQLVLFDNYRRDSLSGLSLAEHPNVTLVAGDVLELGDLQGAAEGADSIVHLAAIAGVSSYYQQPLKTLQVNILGTVNALDAAVSAGVDRFVHFSTSEVFGSAARNVTEEDPHGIGPTSDRRWVYATSKLAGEHFALRYGEEYGFGATSLRPFNVYGPRQTGEGAIANFCQAALKGEPLTVYGDGKAVRSWCYVSDMVDAVVAALRLDTATGQSFNIGNAETGVTTTELAELVTSIVPGSDIRYEQIDRAEVAERIPVIDKAKRLLDYEPKVGLEDGLRSTIDWYRSRLES